MSVSATSSTPVITIDRRELVQFSERDPAVNWMANYKPFPDNFQQCVIDIVMGGKPISNVDFKYNKISDQITFNPLQLPPEFQKSGELPISITYHPFMRKNSQETTLAILSIKHKIDEFFSAIPQEGAK